MINRLLLSFGAILHTLATRRATVNDLDQALFCCTQYELSEAEVIDDPIYEQALSVIAKARKEDRLLFKTGSSSGNSTTLGEVDAFLARHGVAPLLGATGDESRPLYQIPIHCAVPTCSDRSVEVIWAAVPLHSNWKQSWGIEARPQKRRNATWREAVREVGRAWIAQHLGAPPTQLDVNATSGVRASQSGGSDEALRLQLFTTVGGYLALQIVTERVPDTDVDRCVAKSLARLMLDERRPSKGAADNLQVLRLLRRTEAEVAAAFAERTKEIIRIANVLAERQRLSGEEWQSLLAQIKPEEEQPAA